MNFKIFVFFSLFSVIESSKKKWCACVCAAISSDQKPHMFVRVIYHYIIIYVYTFQRDRHNNPKKNLKKIKINWKSRIIFFYDSKKCARFLQVKIRITFSLIVYCIYVYCVCGISYRSGTGGVCLEKKQMWSWCIELIRNKYIFFVY